MEIGLRRLRRQAQQNHHEQRERAPHRLALRNRADVARERREFERDVWRRSPRTTRPGCLRHVGGVTRLRPAAVAHDAIHALAQSEWERHRRRTALEEEHDFVAGRELGRADHEPAIAADLTARHAKVHRLPGLALERIDHRDA